MNEHAVHALWLSMMNDNQRYMLRCIEEYQGAIAKNAQRHTEEHRRECEYFVSQITRLMDLLPPKPVIVGSTDDIVKAVAAVFGPIQPERQTVKYGLASLMATEREEPMPAWPTDRGELQPCPNCGSGEVDYNGRNPNVLECQCCGYFALDKREKT
jgi:hypothetical protein